MKITNCTKLRVLVYLRTVCSEKFKQYETYKLIISGQAGVINRQVNDTLSISRTPCRKVMRYIL